MSKTSKGWVYVLSNPAMPGLVKVGYTTNTPEKRARELYVTGLPSPFVVEHKILVDNPRSIERKAHRTLSQHRKTFNREFFSCTVDHARKVLEDCAEGAIIEQKNRAEQEARNRLAQERHELGMKIEAAKSQITDRYKPEFDHIINTETGKYQSPWFKTSVYMIGIFSIGYTLAEYNSIFVPILMFSPVTIFIIMTLSEAHKKERDKIISKIKDSDRYRYTEQLMATDIEKAKKEAEKNHQTQKSSAASRLRN